MGKIGQIMKPWGLSTMWLIHLCGVLHLFNNIISFVLIDGLCAVLILGIRYVLFLVDCGRDHVSIHNTLSRHLLGC